MTHTGAGVRCAPRGEAFGLSGGSPLTERVSGEEEDDTPVDTGQPACTGQLACTPDEPACTPDEPACTPDEPACTPDEPACTPDEHACTPDEDVVVEVVPVVRGCAAEGKEDPGGG
jgi:hypothetical protein